MYILFLLFGILLYFIINNYDAFSVGVPHIKVYRIPSSRPSIGNTYQVVNMDDGNEPEPHDVGDPIFNGDIDQETYEIIEEIQQQDLSIDPTLIIPDSSQTTTNDETQTTDDGTQTTDQELEDEYKTLLIRNGIFPDTASATDEAKTMVEFTKLTYQFLIDNGLMTREEAIEELRTNPEMLRRFRSDHQLQLSHPPGDPRQGDMRRPRLPRECSAHIISFLNYDDLYEWLLRNINSFDFNILTHYFNPIDYINFINGILDRTPKNKTMNDLQRQLSNAANMLINISLFPIDNVSNICVIFNLSIIPIIREFKINMYTAIFLFMEFYNFINILDLNRRGLSFTGFSYDGLFTEPNIYMFLWLLVSNLLGPYAIYKFQYIIDTYIDINDTVGLLEHLLQDESIRTEFGNIQILREYLIDPDFNHRNLLSMISRIIDYLYRHFNAGR